MTWQDHRKLNRDLGTCLPQQDCNEVWPDRHLAKRKKLQNGRSQEAKIDKVACPLWHDCSASNLTGIMPRLADFQGHRKLKRMKVRTLPGMTALKPGLTGTAPKLSNWRGHRKPELTKLPAHHGMTAVKPGLTGIIPRLANWPGQQKLKWTKMRTLHGMTAVNLTQQGSYQDLQIGKLTGS